MQQRIGVRNDPLCKEIGPLPFPCPQCGEHQRFRSLSSLRAHLDHTHAYHSLHDLSPASRWRPAESPLDHRKAGDGGRTERCKSASMETPRPAGSTERSRAKPTSTGAGSGAPGAAPPGVAPPGDEQGGEEEEAGSEGGAHVQRGPGEKQRGAAGSAMERQLQTVSTDLARADSELQRHRLRSEHLAREKRELFERERALSRQVDSAVVVIATLRRRLTVSEQELERKEQEAITIHHFLEAAVQHEVCGKLRLQDFIESLLQRITLAERVLEFYQSASRRPNCTDRTFFSHFGSQLYPLFLSIHPSPHELAAVLLVRPFLQFGDDPPPPRRNVPRQTTFWDVPRLSTSLCRVSHPHPPEPDSQLLPPIGASGLNRKNSDASKIGSSHSLSTSQSRSAGGLPASGDPAETRQLSNQKGRSSFPKSSGESPGRSPNHKGEARSQRRQLALYEA